MLTGSRFGRRIVLQVLKKGLGFRFRQIGPHAHVGHVNVFVNQKKRCGEVVPQRITGEVGEIECVPREAREAAKRRECLFEARVPLF